MKKRPSAAIPVAAALLATSLALAGACAAAQTDAAAAQPSGAAMKAWPPLDLEAQTFDALRWAAAVGNVDAALVVATRLLDRYERGGTIDDLYETLIWVDRYHSEEKFAQSPLITRIQQKDCDREILRYHWLCASSE